jgi:hypothetical protein
MSDKNDDAIPARWGYRAERVMGGVLPCLPPNQWLRSVIRHRKINTNTDETVLSYTLFGNLTLFFGSRMLENRTVLVFRAKQICRSVLFHAEKTERNATACKPPKLWKSRWAITKGSGDAWEGSGWRRGSLATRRVEDGMRVVDWRTFEQSRDRPTRAIASFAFYRRSGR